MNDRTIGRAGFLGLLGVGAVGLFFARDATGFLGRTVPKSVSSLVPTGAGGSTRSAPPCPTPTLRPSG